MPVYEFRCQDCDDRFEQMFRSMSASKDVVIPCPTCGSKKTERVFSTFAVASEAAKSTPASDMPFCGRCGQNGPCGLDG